jgi:CDP-diacylglycerol--glycerol-3-phosphate 3-phosphatidyltransferase
MAIGARSGEDVQSSGGSSFSPVLNLPNLLTAFRIFLVPLVVVVLLTEFHFERWFFFNREELAVGIFLLASLTDLLDGYLARKRGQVTTLGQLMDPIADKLLVSSVLISLVEMHLAQAWIVVIIVGREFTVTGLRMVAAVSQVTIPAGVLGKWKMVVEVIAISLVIWGNQREWEWVKLTGDGLLYFVAFIAIVSMIEYFVKFSRRIDLFREAKGQPGS